MDNCRRFGLTGVCLLLFGITANARAETLYEAVQQVLTTNPQVRVQVYNRLAADEDLRGAKSGFYPTLRAEAGAGVARHRKPTDEDLDPREVVLTLNQNLFNGFGTYHKIGQQKARVEAAAYRVQGTSEALALEVCRTYLNVLRMQQLKQFAKENLDIHARILAKVQQRSDSGVGTKADTEQVKGRLALAQSNFLVAETNLQDAYSAYLAVVGHMPETLVDPASPGNAMPADSDAAIALAVQNSPNIKAAVSDLISREKQYSALQSPYYPSVDVVVEQRWDEEVTAVDTERDETTVMLKISYTLFSGFSDSSRKGSALQQVSAAKESRNEAERKVVESVRLSWVAYQSNQTRTKLLEDRVRYSRETATAYAQQFELGRRTLLDVLNAEAEVTSAKSELTGAEYDLLLAQYRVLSGTGGLVDYFGLEWPHESVVE